MTGIDLLKSLKLIEMQKQAKYIILSNQSEDSDIEQAYKEGASGYIIKADSIPSEVVEKVHQLVS